MTVPKTHKMDPVIHFEMPAEDTERARTFYETAFGWRTTPLGAEAGDFVLAFTTESDEKTRIPKTRGAINGGLFQRTEPAQGRHSAHHPCGRHRRSSPTDPGCRGRNSNRAIRDSGRRTLRQVQGHRRQHRAGQPRLRHQTTTSGLKPAAVAASTAIRRPTSLRRLLFVYPRGRGCLATE